MKKIFLTAFSMITLLSSIAQNGAHNWVFPGQVSGQSTSSKLVNINISGVTNLPQGPNSIDYQGQIAQKAYGNFTNDDGSLLFFMVDNKVFDKDGYLLANMTQLTNQTTTNITNSHTPSLGSEIEIINVPGECDKYYIVFYHETNNGNNSSTVVKGYYYITIDMNLPNIFYPNRMGSITTYHTENGTFSTIPGLAPYLNYYGRTIEISNYLGSPNEEREGYSISFTQPNNNERFMYLSGRANIKRYRVTNQGFIDDNYDLNNYFQNQNYTYELFYGNGGNCSMTDADIIKLSNGNYKLAVSLQPGAPGWSQVDLPGWNNQNYVQIATIDGNTGDFTNFESVRLPSGGLQLVKGLEFSHNGDYLYSATSSSAGLHVTDLTQIPTNKYYSPTALNVSGAVNYKNGNIEKDLNGKIYFANASGLASLSNSNNPNSTWTSNAIQVYIPSRYGFNGYSDESGYMIPNQLNNENLNHSNQHASNYITYTGNLCNKQNISVYIQGSDMSFTNPIWSNSDGGNSSGYNLTQGTNVIFVDVTNKFGCSERISITLEAGPFLDLAIVSSNGTEYCPNNGPINLTYHVAYQNPGNSIIYSRWTKDGVSYSTNNSTISVNGPGEYCVQVVDQYGYCLSTKKCFTITAGPCINIDPSFTFVQNVGTSDFTVDVTATDTRTCFNQGYWVYDMDADPNNYLFVDWDANGTIENGGSTYKFQFGTNYKIMHGVWSDCQSWTQSIRNISQTNRLRDPNKNSAFSNLEVYPNPTKGEINIKGDTEFSNYYITNTIGSKIIEGSNLDLKIDVNNVDNGLYFITFLNQEGDIIETKKIIKN